MWSEKVLCIKCNEGGNLLVCSEDGCPLAVHEGCTGVPARFDDAGRYYCPYCSYKQAVAEIRETMEHVLAKKEDLMHFMDGIKMGSEKGMEENERAENKGRSELKCGEANEEIITRKNTRSKVNCHASLDQSKQPDEVQQVDSAEEEEVQREESEGPSGSKSPKLHEEHSVGYEVEKNNQEENQRISNEEEETMNQKGEQIIDNEVEKNNQEEKQSTSNEEETRNQEGEQTIDNVGKKDQEEHETSAASSSQDPSIDEAPSLPVRATSTKQSKGKQPVGQDSEAVSARTSPIMKKKTSPSMKKKASPTMNSPRKYSALEATKGSNQVVGSPKGSKQSENPPLNSGKRKRVPWTEAEEEALKEGVKKFSKEANVNMPWRKILDYGKDVFDECRSPSDLKDKWRSLPNCVKK